MTVYTPQQSTMQVNEMFAYRELESAKSLATASALLGGIGSLFVPLLPAIAALITGNLAKKKIKFIHPDYTSEVKRRANIGIIAGWIVVGFYVAGVILLGFLALLALLLGN